MSISELYLPADRYAFEVALITNVLQNHVPADPEDAHVVVHAQLRAAGIDMGGSKPATSREERSCRFDLIEALIALQPSPFTGEIDNSDVRLILGEIGNVWPSSVRETPPDEIASRTFVTSRLFLA